jgi:hypothetical protein
VTMELRMKDQFLPTDTRRSSTALQRTNAHASC